MTDDAAASPGFTPDADWPPWPSASFVDAAALHVVRLWLPDWFAWAHDRLRVLSADERARAERFYFEPVRQRFIACRLALRSCLARCLDCNPAELVFDYGPHGKPRLASVPHLGGLSFNVAHSADVALIAIGRHCELGVDVEAIPPTANWRGIAQRFLADSEWSQIQALPVELQSAGFYRAWTCKEAYLKATGRGMSLPLGRFAVCTDPRLPPRLVATHDNPGDAARFLVRVVNPAPGYAGAVMWEGATKEMSRWTWSA